MNRTADSLKDSLRAHTLPSRILALKSPPDNVSDRDAVRDALTVFNEPISFRGSYRRGETSSFHRLRLSPRLGVPRRSVSRLLINFRAEPQMRTNRVNCANTRRAVVYVVTRSSGRIRIYQMDIPPLGVTITETLERIDVTSRSQISVPLTI